MDGFEERVGRRAFVPRPEKRRPSFLITSEKSSASLKVLKARRAATAARATPAARPAMSVLREDLLISI